MILITQRVKRERSSPATHTPDGLLVFFTEREDGIRIINARKPDKDERHHHEEESRR